MTLNEFRQDPTGLMHPVYRQSMLTVAAAEYATGEVLLGSVYRKLLLDIRDARVDLTKIPELRRKLDEAFARIDPAFRSVSLAHPLLLEMGGIASPQKSGQLGLQPLRSLMPIVPEIARHACVIGRVRSRWYPGNLLLQVIGAGLDEAQGNELIIRLTDALLVKSEDDLFARFLSQFVEEAEPGDGTLPVRQWRVTPDEDQRAFRGQLAQGNMSPSERFCRDLDAVMAVKPQLTRRQWSVLLEAALRLGLVTHVLWVCQVNSICWELALEAAGGMPVPNIQDVETKLWNTHREVSPLIEIGRPIMPGMKRILEKYLAARFGLNVLLCSLEDGGQPFPGVIGFDSAHPAASAMAVCNFLSHVSSHRLNIDRHDPQARLRQVCSELCDEHPSELSSTKGSTKNLREFIVYSLGQLKTTPPEKRSYDQSFLLTTDDRRKPPITQPGPAMLIFLAHACCYAHGDLPVSFEDFRTHLADYGLSMPAGELLTGKLCNDLQNLGLIVDSPDAAGGRLLVRPF